MKLNKLIPKEECVSGKLCGSLEITSLAHHHEAITKGTLFFHLKSTSGGLTDAKKIINKRPAAIVTEFPELFRGEKVPVIAVKSSRRALATAYAAFSEIRFDDLIFVGVTGTNGKTTVATMLKAIFEHSGKRCGFIGTGKIISDNVVISGEDYSMTCPDPNVLYPAIKRMQDDGCEIIIMEVSSHALFLEKTAPIPFRVGIFTGISPEHLDFHKNMESYLAAKEILIERAKYAIINIDDKGGRQLYEKYKAKSRGAGIIWQGDVSATDICNLGLGGCKYIYRTPGCLTMITLKIPGIYNVYNSMLATAAATRLGVVPRVCKEALGAIEKIDGRMEIIEDDITVIIDYAHTPFALENLLKTVNIDKRVGQNIIVVFGCGGDRDKEKRPLMAEVAERYADKIIVTSDNSRTESVKQIISDITSGFHSDRYGVICDRAEAIKYAILTASAEDLVIIAGKGHEKYILDESGFRHFDEKQIIKNALRLRKEIGSQ